MHEELLFSVRNRHVAASGSPPRINADDANQYVGYFETHTESRRSTVYEPRDAQTAVVYLGDAGWDTAHAVVDGRVPDLVLNESERLWRTRVLASLPRRVARAYFDDRH